jgi:hypothetical protein
MKRIFSLLILVASSAAFAGETGLQQPATPSEQEVWTSSTLFVRQTQGQVRGINEDSDRRINALRTGDQQKAYATFEQERKLQRRLRRVQSEQATN